MYNNAILLDMDEVLCDFVGGACRVHGWTRSELEIAWPIGRWSIVEPMGLTPTAFWNKIDAAGEAFWFDLEPTPWLDDLVILLGSLVGNGWHIVSTPSLCARSFAGKVRWIRKHLGRKFKRFLFTYDKTLLARPSSLLIDDREETVKSFVDAGGEGMVFPCRHNSFYAFSHDPLAHIKTLLEEQTDALSFSERQRRLPPTRYGLR